MRIAQEEIFGPVVSLIPISGLDEAIEGTGIEILRVKNSRVLERAMSGMDVDETLDDLDATDVFKRCLESHEVPEDQRPELLSTYQEIIASLNEQDQMAE